jgi:hypothetical protein
MLSLPPEIGRGELRDINLLFALLAAQLLIATYLTSGFASAELALESEKGLPDLVLSAFSPWAIAAGKIQSSALYACYLVAAAVPLAVLAASLRGMPLHPILWAALVTIAVATAAGTWGAWMGGRFSSDFTRSFLHWVMLGAVFVGTAMLPAPWSISNPVRLIERAVRDGWSVPMSGVVAAYVGAAAGGAALIASYVRGARDMSEE